MDFKRAWRWAIVAVILCGLSTTGYAGANGVKVSSGTLSFGNCTVGASCGAQTVTVTNSARESVKIESATLSSSQFAYSGPTLPLILGPGQSFTGSVLFVPTAAQTNSGELTFERANLQRISVGLRGTGIVPVQHAPVTPTITWTAPAAINYGAALSAAQLDASANTAGSFIYSPALGTVLTAGNQSLSVTFTPSDTTDYNTATGSVVLTVNKVTPTITWAAPAAITSGTPLSATQLDATANTAGSFTYSPALGTVLGAGSQTLSVTFKPSNAIDYNSATGSVVLTVNSGAPATGTLTVNPTSVTLGNVIIGANSSETVTLTNSGSGSVTISGVSISGPGVSASGVSSGIVLASGQTASLDLTFTASSTGNITGGVTILSNASDASLTIPMSASGVSPTVSLSWSADSSATGGYNVYSSTVSGGPYNLAGSTPSGTPAYSDNAVQAGLTYYYVVTAIDVTTNVQSGYSNQATVVIP
jgi:hypothetical protein